MGTRPVGTVGGCSGQFWCTGVENRTMTEVPTSWVVTLAPTGRDSKPHKGRWVFSQFSPYSRLAVKPTDR